MMDARIPADLAPLAPRRSTLRNVVLSALAVLALVGAWFSPALLRPTLVGNDQGGWGSRMADSFLVISWLRPEAWPHATLESVEPLPGATPLRVWVFDGEAEESSEVSPAEDALQFLRETYPSVDFAENGNLPHVLRSGQRLQIAVEWRVTDCAALLAGRDGQDFPERVTPDAVIRSALGRTSRTTLGSVASPATFGLDEADLCG